MATFEVKVYKLKIETHPNADVLELARVGDYVSCVRKGELYPGDLGVYIPEGSVVPEWILEQIGLKDKLAGPQKNRVKAMKLRGILSQGLIYPVKRITPGDNPNIHEVVYGSADDWILIEEGQDVQEYLGITKYEPPIPVYMAGEVFNAFGYTINYDIENIKKFPDILKENEEVIITEKLHGTWTCFGYNPESQNFSGRIVTSKGQSGAGLAFKLNETNHDNLYIRSLRSTEHGEEIRFDEILGEKFVQKINIIDRGIKHFQGTPFYILGETFGKGVQDLDYGLTKPEFRVFDIYIGQPGQGEYLDTDDLQNACKALDVAMVPIIYRGCFSKIVLDQMTSGKETISGKHIREGVVVKPIIERRDELLGRVLLKSVSENYLLRKNENATEFN